MSELFNCLLDAVSQPLRHLAPTSELFATEKQLFIDRVVPARTLSISLTDHDCQQNCAHCNGHYLKGMQPFSKLSGVDLSKYEAVLISGGSNSAGEVPMREHINSILALPKHLKLNLHVGFQQPEALLPLKIRNPIISFDLPSCDAVVKEVYGLDYPSESFRLLYQSYCRHFRTVAHVTLGLAPAGHHNGERETISFLATAGASEVVFLVFRPTPGTRMCQVQPPALTRIIPLLVEARQNFPGQVQLGCMRPAGTYRRDLDILTWMHGYRRFVMPDHQLLQILTEHAVPVNSKNNCCALEK